MLPFFADLITRTDEARREFETNPVVLDAVAHGMPIARYRSLLLELYHLVWHFNPVCAAAASRVPDKLRQVRYFLYEHMHEESGHEQWVTNDLDAVGVSQATLLAHRRDPCSALGMMYTLEVIASVYGGTFAEAIRSSLLLEGDRGVSFISSHATMDAEHMAELRQVLNTVDDEAAREAIVESTLVNFHHVTRVFEAV